MPTPTRTPFVPRTQVASSAPTATPVLAASTLVPGAPTATPFVPTVEPGGSSSASATPTMSFVHTQPGVQSEVYLDIQVASGVAVTATLTGPGIVGSAQQSAVAGIGGQVRLTWIINLDGNYSATGSAGAASFNSSVSVQ